MGAAVLFGLSTPLAKIAVAGVAPQLAAGLFYCGSGIGLAIVGLVRSQRPPPLQRAHRGRLALAILFGGILAPPLQLTGIAATPASTASLLLNLESVLTALVAWIAFREHVNAATGVGMALIVAGSGVLSGGDLRAASVAGPLAIAGACLCWALDNNVTQTVSGSDAVTIACTKGLVAGAVNVSLALATGAAWPAPAAIAGALAIGFVCYGLSLVLFVQALAALGTARTGAYFSLAPFVGALAGVVALGEPMSAQLALAAVLMALGTGLHVTERHEHEHTHAAAEHAHPHVHDEHHRHEHAPGDPAGEPHVHPHRHERLVHSHAHYPDLDHRHDHGAGPDGK